jgi:hypothetical protein
MTPRRSGPMPLTLRWSHQAGARHCQQSAHACLTGAEDRARDPLRAEIDTWLVTYNTRRKNKSDFMRGRTPRQVLDTHHKKRPT